MSTDSLKGKVLTVLGAIEPSELGVTLTHEHLLADSGAFMIDPKYVPQSSVADLDLKMENLGMIRQHPYSAPCNLKLDDAEEMIEELKLYKQCGGGSLIDLTSIGIRVDPTLLPRISQESGVKIVAGTAYYVDSFLPQEAHQLNTREMADVLVGEVMGGIGGGGDGGDGGGRVRCGIIGEVGCSWPLTGTEKRSLQAAALAQQETGAAINVHPGRNESSPFEILDVLESAGADISRTVISHLDRTITSHDRLLELAKRGCYLEFDLFGIEVSHYQLCATTDMPSDAQRIQSVKFLIEKGYLHRILLSQDIHTKNRLVKYGGHGFSHLLQNVVPKMLDRGIKQEDIVAMTTTNVQELLTFV